MSTRMERVGELIKQEVSQILLKDMNDPRIGFVTVTDVVISPDIRYATVFVSIMGTDGDRKARLKILAGAAGFVRQLVGGRIRLRAIPEIEFRLDTSIDKGMRMTEILEQIKNDDQG